MRELAGREDARGNLFLFAGCVAVALVALALPANWSQGLAAAVRRTVLRPLVFLAEKGRESNASRFRLVGIEQHRDSLALVVQSTAIMRRENVNLRALVGLTQRITTPYVAAEVLHRGVPTDERTILIGAGTIDSVRDYDPVIAPEGLIGYIWQAGPRAAAVMTWLHPEFRASAVTEDGKVLGVIVPAGGPEGRQQVLRLTGVARRDTVAPGTQVFTAGLGGVYPRGIPVGVITAMEEDPLGYEVVYRVMPFANPGAATHVMVLTAPRDSLFLELPSERPPRLPGDTTRPVADTSRARTDSAAGARP